MFDPVIPASDKERQMIDFINHLSDLHKTVVCTAWDLEKEKGEIESTWISKSYPIKDTQDKANLCSKLEYASRGLDNLAHLIAELVTKYDPMR